MLKFAHERKIHILKELVGILHATMVQHLRCIGLRMLFFIQVVGRSFFFKIDEMVNLL